MPIRINGRDELLADPELPPAAQDPRRWVRQDVTVNALRDNHLIGASLPVAFGPGSQVVNYSDGEVAHLQDSPLSRGEKYTVWSVPLRRDAAAKLDAAAARRLRHPDPPWLLPALCGSDGADAALSGGSSPGRSRFHERRV